MKTTQQFSITLPHEMAKAVESKNGVALADGQKTTLVEREIVC